MGEDRREQCRTTYFFRRPGRGLPLSPCLSATMQSAQDTAPRPSAITGGEPMQLQLSEEERQLLAELLDQDFRNLREEIYKTDSFDYKEALKARERLLVGLLSKIGPPTVAEPE